MDELNLLAQRVWKRVAMGEAYERPVQKKKKQQQKQGNNLLLLLLLLLLLRQA